MAQKSSSSVRKYNGTALPPIFVKIKPPNMCNMYARAYIISLSAVTSIEGFEN
jgi:hypothetical protein